MRGLSLVVASRGYSSLRCTGFSLRWLLLLRSTGSRCAGFSSCGSRAPVVVWHAAGLVAPRHVGSSRTRARTRVPCIGRQILNHCATRGALMICFHLFKFINSCVYLGDTFICRYPFPSSVFSKFSTKYICHFRNNRKIFTFKVFSYCKLTLEKINLFAILKNDAFFILISLLLRLT